MKTTKNTIKKWPYIPDYLYRILIIGASRSGKTNTLLNSIKEQDDIDKIYLHGKDLSDPKYEFLIKKHEDVGTNHFNDPNAFIECSNRMDDYNASRKIKILMVFDDMIADIMSNKKFQAIIKELFIRCRKVNISLVFITQSYFCFERCEIKFNTLFDYENQQQKTITKCCN